MDRRRAAVGVLWLPPMIGAGYVSWQVPIPSLVWGLAVAGTVLAAANAALNLDLATAAARRHGPERPNRA